MISTVIPIPISKPLILIFMRLVRKYILTKRIISPKKEQQAWVWQLLLEQCNVFLKIPSDTRRHRWFSNEIKLSDQTPINESYKCITAEVIWGSKACVCYFLSNFCFSTKWYLVLPKLWKVFFTSSKKLFLLLRYSNYCKFFSFHTFKIQIMEVE